MAVDMYEKEAPQSILRLRMLANSVKTPLYARFKRIDYDGSDDLFRGGVTVTKNTYNISGGIQAGAVSVGGDAENSGQVSIH
jgi:hypothetical protein